jgi:high-affinity iron transporter
MLEALIVTLREGVEAALVVGIIVVFLRRQGYEKLLSSVWAGIGAATLASLVGAYALYRFAVNEELFEGVLYLGSALLVASMAIWMWRHAPAIAGEVRGSLGRILERRAGVAAWTGVFLFTFLMVLREGIETVAFLSAISLGSGGVWAFLGAALGLVLAVLFGVLFTRGVWRVDLRRFFAITGLALAIFVVQLLLNGYHELSEARVFPASERTMALVGPLVRHDFFFLAAVLALPLLLLLVPGKQQLAAEPAPNPAAARLERARSIRQRRGRQGGAVLGLAILLVLGLHAVYGQDERVLSPATPVPLTAEGVRLALQPLLDGKLHRFAVEIDGTSTRFIAIATGEDDKIALAFDACEICGAHGYVEDGTAVACLHCGSAIYPPSIGQTGGCNPIPLTSSTETGTIVIARADLERGAPLFH